MKLSQMMTFKSVVCLFIGLVFVLIPGFLLTYFGVPNSEPSGMFYMARLYGATFLLLGLLLWLGRNLAEADARRVIVPAVFVGDALGFLVVLGGQLGGMMNALGWSVVLLYLLLTVGFGYFLLAKPTAQTN